MNTNDFLKPVPEKGRKKAPLSPLERYWRSEWRLYDELDLACFKQ